jgi:hypothetical protein
MVGWWMTTGGDLRGQTVLLDASDQSAPIR